jgi:ferredoxin
MRRRTLLTTARRAGVRVGFPCRGEGVCGKCTVEVVEGADALEPPTPEERRLATHAGLSAHERISCLCTPRPGHRLLLRVGGGTYPVDT